VVKRFFAFLCACGESTFAFLRASVVNQLLLSSVPPCPCGEKNFLLPPCLYVEKVFCFTLCLSASVVKTNQKNLMMAKKTFTEKQRFNQWWLMLLMIVITGLAVWGFVQQVILGIPLGNNPAPDTVLYFVLALPILIFLFIRSIALNTRVDSRGVSWRFAPLHRKERHLSWKEIATAQVFRYHPIRDYGGWGYRVGRAGKAYSVSGSFGLEITLHKGTKLLIGTQKPDELKSLLQLFNADESHDAIFS
jgi:hypothetical protein